MSRASRQVFHRALRELCAATGAATLGEPDPSASGEPTAVRFRAQKLVFDTPFRVPEAAAAALAAGAHVARAIRDGRGGGAHHGSGSEVSVDSRHAESSLLSFAHLKFADESRGIGPRIAAERRTAAAGFYRTGDARWIYLHAGFPHNTQGLLQLLDVPDDRDRVESSVAGWRAQDLEDAIAEAGLNGAMARTPTEWDQSGTGQLLATRPVVDIVQVGDSAPEPFPAGRRMLNGLRVLDLTRILAGPTCARTLAAYGAEVLRVGADHLPHVPLFAVDTGFGKRAASLDLRDKADAARLRRLLRQADVFSQGYRTGAMERLGFGVTEVARQRPGIIYVSINCYGHEGEWRPRPGWEQLAQTVTGMALTQAHHQGAAEPTLLPAAVNDYITGYLGAFGALAALERRARLGGSYWVRVSLARTAMWVRSLGLRSSTSAMAATAPEIESWSATMDSEWGPLTYLRPAVSLEGERVGWSRPPSPLGNDPARF